MAAEITLSYTTLLDDMLVFNRWLFEREPRLQASLRNSQRLAAISGFGLGFAGLWASRLPWWSALALALLLGFLLRGLVKRLFINQIIRKVRELYLKGPAARALGDCSLSLTAQGLAHSTPTAQELLPYGGIKSVERAGSYSFILLDDTRAICVPGLRINQGEPKRFMEALKARMAGRG
jgi:hypothetical protein